MAGDEPSPIDAYSIGNAKIAGMADDLKLNSSEYSIALVVFFGKFVAQSVRTMADRAQLAMLPSNRHLT